MKKIHKYEKQIIQHERKALGYEDTMSFNYGYIASLLTNKLISRKEYNILIKVYTADNTNGLFYIGKNGNLAKEKELLF